MDIIAQLKAERDKAAQQLNALDTAIKALSGLNSTAATRGRRTSKNFCRTESTLGQGERSAEGCLNSSQTPHLSSRVSKYQKGN